MTAACNNIIKLNKTITKIEHIPDILIKDISIIIPVKSNQKGIDDFLYYFFRTQQKYPKELIIVDNNSNKPICISKKYKNFDFIKLVKCNKIGPASARNYGVKLSKGTWILFTDSDCIPTESFLNGYEYVNKNCIGYAGNVTSFGTDAISKYYETQKILIPLPIYNSNVPSYLITANCLILKKAIELLGGFNECFKLPAGEDIDLSIRLSKVGTLDYATKSTIKHNFSDGMFGFIKRFIRYGKGAKIIEEIHEIDMKPKIFSPNEYNILNNLLSKCQYILLKIGYNIK